LARAEIIKQAKEKALQLYRNGDYAGSIKISEAGLKISPRDDEFMMICATCYLELENWNAGLNYLKNVVKYSSERQMKDLCNDVINELESGEYQQRARANKK
jgi:hypothetical protein